MGQNNISGCIKCVKGKCNKNTGSVSKSVCSYKTEE
jgi:hypothetical protein